MYKKLILTTALGLVMFASDSLAVTEGKCGANCTYIMDDAGNVVVSGTGALGTLQGVNKSDIKSVSVGEGITKIGDNAFNGATSLAGIDLPSSVTSIGGRAFQNTGITDVEIPATVTDIAGLAFYQSPVQSVKIQGENINLSKNSFGYYSGDPIQYAGTITWSCGSNCVATLDQDGHVEFVGSGAMNGVADGFARYVKEAKIGEGITKIGDNAFNGATSLAGIDLPSSVTSIGGRAFQNTGITDVEIPATVTDIGGLAFYQSPVQNVKIQGENINLSQSSFEYYGGNPIQYAGTITWSCGSNCVATLDQDGHVEFVGSGAMSGVAKGFLGSVITATVGEGITSIGGDAFYGAKSLISIDFPDSLESIGFRAFSGDGSLEKINLPDSLKDIAGQAFYYTGLQQIILPPSLENIGSNTSLSGKTILYYSDEQKEKLKALGYKDSALTPYIINDDGTVYYTDKEGFDIRFGTYNAFKKDEVLEKYKLGADGRTYVYSADNQLRAVFQKNADGSTYIYDENGKLKEIKGKKIYTVEEAMAVTRDGNVNHVRLTYK